MNQIENIIERKQATLIRADGTKERFRTVREARLSPARKGDRLIGIDGREIRRSTTGGYGIHGRNPRK